jgi:hypothetical protein
MNLFESGTKGLTFVRSGDTRYGLYSAIGAVIGSEGTQNAHFRLVTNRTVIGQMFLCPIGCPKVGNGTNVCG